jgi:hypothetical protein
MKFKKAVFLHALMVCAFLNILQEPLFANDQQHEEEADALMHDDNEAQDATKGRTSFFSRYTKRIMIGGAVVATLALAGLGYHFWKPKDSDKKDSDYKESDCLEYLSHQLPLSTQSTTIQDLQAQMQAIGKQIADSKPTPQNTLELRFRALNIAVKQAHQELAKAGSDVHAAFAAYDTSKAASDIYKQFLIDNPVSKKLRTDAETVLSQRHDITKEQLHFLGVTAIRAGQIYIKKNREAIAQSLTAKASGQLEKSATDMTSSEESRAEAREWLARIKGTFRELLDSLSQQSVDALVDLLQRVILSPDLTADPTDEQTEAFNKDSATWSESTTKSLQKKGTDKERYQLLQDMLSQLKGGHLPPLLQEIIEKIPGVSEVFPEIQKGTMPPLMQPFVTCYIGLEPVYEKEKYPNKELTTEQCLQAMKRCVTTVKDTFEKLREKCSHFTLREHLKQVMEAPKQQPATMAKH